MAYQQKYYSGQGKVMIAEKDRVTGLPTGGFRWLGNVPELKMSLSVTAVDHNESFTGQSLTDARFETKNMGKLMVTLEEYNKENLNFAYYGSNAVKTGASVTNEALKASLGQSVPLANINVTTFTSLVIPGGTPTVLTSPGDYTVNLKTGLITFAETPATVALTDGLTVQANYTYGTYDENYAFSKANDSYWIRFDGLNRVYSDADGDYEPVILNFPSVRFTPPSERNFISDDFSKMSMEGLMMYEQRVIGIAGGYAIPGGFYREQTIPRA